VDATGLVTGHILGASAITATVTHCRTFQAQLPVQVVPREYEVHGKLGDCEWDAPFCYFNSISAPLPFKVRLTWKDDGTPIAGQEVFVSVNAPRAISPVVGPTNAEGIFEAAITGIPVTHPYVFANASSNFGGLWKQIQVRAITDDICSGEITPGRAPFGTAWEPYVKSTGTVSYVTEPCTEVGNVCLIASASASSLLVPYGQYSQRQLDAWDQWWDTALVIPKDLTMLERREAVIDFSLENQESMTADYVKWGIAYVTAKIRPPGRGACVGSPNDCSSYLDEARGYSMPSRSSRFWVETSQFPGKDEFTVGRPVSFWGSLEAHLNVGATVDWTGTPESTASASLSVSQRATITGVRWMEVQPDSSLVWRPLEAWIFSCSGKFTTPR